MKSLRVWRIWLLLLMAVLLPLRGAIAAAMLCPGAMPARSASAQATEPPPCHGEAMDATSPPSADHAALNAHGAAAPEGCNLCAAYCSLTPMPHEPLGVAEPPGLAHSHAPAPAERTARYVCGGQDRPPRSC